MAVDDELIDNFLEFTGRVTTRDQATQFLRQCNSNVETAIDKFFAQGLDFLKPDDNTWDNTAFGGDYGLDAQQSNLPSFNIEYPTGQDHYPHSGAGSVAPTRPPSRVSNRSGTSATHADDTPMQSIETGQESGVIPGTGNSKPMFGPANRDHYDANQWALVPTSTSAEIIPDAVTSQRKRDPPHSPVILKPLPDGEYLPALITILHSIPLCRNTFLTPERTQPDYYAGEDWWKGNPSSQARTVEIGIDTDTVQDHEIIYETQRLMAFLDDTTRAYGSVGGLQQCQTMRETRATGTFVNPKDQTQRFFDNWGPAYTRQTERSLDGVIKSVAKVGNETQDSWFLELDVIPNNGDKPKTLYDLVDESLQLSAEPEHQAFITRISNVLVFRIRGDSKKDRLGKFPVTFYADRYLEENSGIVRKMFEQKSQYDKELSELSKKEHGLRYTKTKRIRPGEQVEVLKLLKSSMAAFQPKTDDDAGNASKDAETLSQLQAVHDSIEKKLKELEERKKEIQDLVDGFSSQFSAPFDDGLEMQTNGVDTKTNGQTTAAFDVQTDRAERQEHGQTSSASDLMDTGTSEPLPIHEHTHAYHLRGVSTRRGVYYMPPTQAKPDDPEGDKWWRLEYTTATGDQAYVFRERVPLATVIDNASSEHHTALLVYANDSALKTQPLPLSEPLEHFVKKDNQDFEKELQSDWGFGVSDDKIEPLGGWDQDPSNYADDWAHYGGSSTSLPDSTYHRTNADTDWKNSDGLSAFANAERGQEKPADCNRSESPTLSSATLTPNTEIEDEGDGVGNDVRRTIEIDPMDITDEDTPMTDANTHSGNPTTETSTEHIERVPEKKGGWEKPEDMVEPQPEKELEPQPEEKLEIQPEEKLEIQPLCHLEEQPEEKLETKPKPEPELEPEPQARPRSKSNPQIFFAKNKAKKEQSRREKLVWNSSTSKGRKPPKSGYFTL